MGGEADFSAAPFAKARTAPVEMTTLSLGKSRFFVRLEDDSSFCLKRMAGCDVTPFVLDWQWSGEMLVRDR